MDVVVLGAGTIGSTVAYSLVTECSDVTVRLVDVKQGSSRGHAIDTTHATAHATHSIGRSSGRPTGRVEVVEPGPASVTGTDCIVNSASVPRPADASQRGGRVAWLEANREVVETVGGWLRENDPCPVVSITNPLDIITYELYRESGWPRHCFLGYSLSETARLADELARTYDVAHEDVYCPVLGEHGEHMVPVFSQAEIRGEPVDLTAAERDRLVEYMQNVPYTVIDLRGEADSSRWVTGRGAVLTVQALLEGGIERPVGLSTPLQGEYGREDVAVSVPVTFDADGVTDIVEWEFSTWERARFEAACDSVSSNIR